MDNEQKELLRHALLLQLDAANPASLPLGALRTGVRLSGALADDDTLARELAYLRDKRMVVEQTGNLAHGVKRYRIAAEGRDYLESLGLARERPAGRISESKTMCIRGSDTTYHLT